MSSATMMMTTNALTTLLLTQYGISGVDVTSVEDRGDGVICLHLDGDGLQGLAGEVRLRLYHEPITDIDSIIPTPIGRLEPSPQ